MPNLNSKLCVILNIKIGDTQRQIKPIHNLYKKVLNSILDGNIDNIMAEIIYTKLGLIK